MRPDSVKKTGLRAVAEADQILKERVAEMKQKMSDAGKVLADAKGGKAIDNRAIWTALQSVNIMYRDGNELTLGKGDPQVDRLLRPVGGVSPEARSVAAPLEARFKNERKALSSRYL